MKAHKRIVEIKVDDKTLIKESLRFINFYPHVGYLLKDLFNRIKFDGSIGIDLESIKNFSIEIKKESEFLND